MTIYIIGVICVLNLILSIINFIGGYSKKPKRNKGEDFSFTGDNFVQIEEHLVEDITEYCKSKYNLDVFKCFDTDQISLACKDTDGKNNIILQLRFPLKDRDTPEYMNVFELMKEEVDDWRRKQNA